MSCSSLVLIILLFSTICFELCTWLVIQIHLLLESIGAYDRISIGFQICSVFSFLIELFFILICEILFVSFQFLFDHLYMLSKSCISLIVIFPCVFTV